ncbi:MAG: hypothetical protein GXO69_07660 [Acidobacteria bacterium]|nr:hypothetical protein [Acidobacteriota bacterium]
MKIMMPLIDRLSAPCDVITEKISESMDYPISWRDKVRIRFHILFCRFCNRYRRQLFAIREMLGSGPAAPKANTISGTECLSDEAKERIRKEILKRKS